LAVAIVVHAISCKAPKGAAKCSCPAGPLVEILGKLVGLATVASFAVLLVTGFYYKIVMKETIHGYGLMLHASAAPVFIACLAALAVLGADSSRLNKNYLPWLNTLLGRKGAEGEAFEPFELSRKICFWIIMVLALPLAMSIVASMLPIFGTHMQEMMGDLHRYVALGTAMVMIFSVYLGMRSKA